MLRGLKLFISDMVGHETWNNYSETLVQFTGAPGSC